MTKPSTEALGQATLAIDAIMCRNDILEIAEHLRAGLPPDLLDQSDAATDEVRRNFAKMGALLGGRTGGGMPSEFPGWIRIGVFDTLVNWLADNIRLCMHGPHPDRPQPIFAAAWKPGLIVCSNCIYLLPVARNSAADRTCDGCGHVRSGADADDPIYPSAVTYGPLTLMFGVCNDCAVLEPLDAPKETS